MRRRRAQCREKMPSWILWRTCRNNNRLRRSPKRRRRGKKRLLILIIPKNWRKEGLDAFKLKGKRRNISWIWTTTSLTSAETSSVLQMKATEELLQLVVLNSKMQEKKKRMKKNSEFRVSIIIRILHRKENINLLKLYFNHQYYFATGYTHLKLVMLLVTKGVAPCRYAVPGLSPY